MYKVSTSSDLWFRKYIQTHTKNTKNAKFYSLSLEHCVPIKISQYLECGCSFMSIAYFAYTKSMEYKVYGEVNL